MLIELKPMEVFPSLAFAGMVAMVLLLAVALFILLRRKGKSVQAIAAPVVLLATFFGMAQHELSRVYSIEVKGDMVVAHTPLGPTATNCAGIEFLIQKRKHVCVVRAFRGEYEIFYSVGVAWPRCKDLQDQLRVIPCKQSDEKLGHG